MTFTKAKKSVHLTYHIEIEVTKRLESDSSVGPEGTWVLDPATDSHYKWMDQLQSAKSFKADIQCDLAKLDQKQFAMIMKLTNNLAGINTFKYSLNRATNIHFLGPLGTVPVPRLEIEGVDYKTEYPIVSVHDGNAALSALRIKNIHPACLKGRNIRKAYANLEIETDNLKDYIAYLNYLLAIEYEESSLQLIAPHQKNGPSFKVEKMKGFDLQGRPKYSVRGRITSVEQDTIVTALVRRHMPHCEYVFVESDAESKNFFKIWNTTKTLIKKEMNFNLYDTYDDENTKGQKFFQVIWMHQENLEGRFYDGNEYLFPDYVKNVKFVFGTKYDKKSAEDFSVHPSDSYVEWLSETELVTADIDDGAGMWERSIAMNATRYRESLNPWVGLKSVKTYVRQPARIFSMFTNRRLRALNSMVLIGKKSVLTTIIAYVDTLKNGWTYEKDRTTPIDSGFRAYKFTKNPQNSH